MKKQIVTSVLASIIGISLAASAQAAPFDGTTELQDQLDARTQGGVSSINVETDMIADSGDSTWGITASTGSFNTILFEIAGYAEGNSFGIYDLGNINNRIEIFAGTDSNPGNPFDGATTTLEYFGGSFTTDAWTTHVNFASGNAFGYYLDVSDTGQTYYTDTALNVDGYDHMFAYKGLGIDQFSSYNNAGYALWTANEYVLAWEDLLAGGDEDFADFVVMVESVNPVPEPTTMLLFGAGLAGLAGVARRRRK